MPKILRSGKYILVVALNIVLIHGTRVIFFILQTTVNKSTSNMKLKSRNQATSILPCTYHARENLNEYVLRIPLQANLNCRKEITTIFTKIDKT